MTKALFNAILNNRIKINLFFMSRELKIELGPKSPTRKIIGLQLTPEEFAKETALYQRWRGKESRKLERKKLPLTKKQEQVVGLIDKKFKELAKDFNPPELAQIKIKIYPLKFADFIQFMKEEEASAQGMLGGYDVLRQCVVLNQIKDFTEDKFLDAWTANLAHEKIHGKSYQSIQISKKHPQFKRSAKRRDIYRFGPQIYGRLYGLAARTEYFDWLNEALVTELSSRITEAIINENRALYSESIPEKEKNADYYKLQEKNLPYPVYREVLRKMAQGIAKKNNIPMEEVYNKFYQSLFTGHLKEAAGLIEQTYGPGSFRVMANVNQENCQWALKYLDLDTLPQIRNKYVKKIISDELIGGLRRERKYETSEEYKKYKKYKELIQKIRETKPR